jgi:hypothetical protein
MTAGLRFDQFYHQYNNKLSTDTTFSGVGLYKAQAGIVSPKLNFYYHAGNNLQFYLSAGRGFHSNDTRVTVAQRGANILPAAYSADLGAVFKPLPQLLVQAAVWNIYLEQEYVYGGDGGTVDFSGRTERKGFDLSGRYGPLPSLYFDLDITYAHGRALDAQKGQNYIPLAPVWTSSAGVTYGGKNGFNGSLRYRWLGPRPANENNSLVAAGYFVIDAVINYTRPRYEIGLIVNNVFNVRWKETQFATLTRLKGEVSPIEDVCFTPGTPLAARLSWTVHF